MFNDLFDNKLYCLGSHAVEKFRAKQLVDLFKVQLSLTCLL